MEEELKLNSYPLKMIIRDRNEENNKKAAGTSQGTDNGHSERTTGEETRKKMAISIPYIRALEVQASRAFRPVHAGTARDTNGNAL